MALCSATELTAATKVQWQKQMHFNKTSLSIMKHLQPRCNWTTIENTVRHQLQLQGPVKSHHIINVFFRTLQNLFYTLICMQAITRMKQRVTFVLNRNSIPTFIHNTGQKKNNLLFLSTFNRNFGNNLHRKTELIQGCKVTEMWKMFRSVHVVD